MALMAGDQGRLPFAVRRSRHARGVIRQNLVVALVVIAALIVSTATSLVGIGAAVVAHEGSTLIVIANALRLLAYGSKGSRSARLLWFALWWVTVGAGGRAQG